MVPISREVRESEGPEVPGAILPAPIVSQPPGACLPKAQGVAHAIPQPFPHLLPAIASILRHPVHTLAGGFNWKTATLSAMLRAAMFFFTNLRSGHQLALRATVVEACYATCASGILGAVTERLRNARPAWATGLVIWFAIPASLLTAQFFVHRAFGTPQLRTSMIGSFCFAALGTGFNWFAMRRGAMIVGAHRRSFTHDLRALPGILWAFLTALPRALFRR